MHRILWEPKGHPSRQQLIRPSRWTLHAGQSLQVHDHDYVEVFWLEEGACQHLCNDQQEQLETGACVFIRPRDGHGFAHSGQQPVTWVNVSIRQDLHDTLRLRHHQELGWWPWDGGPQPHQGHLAQPQRATLAEAAERLPIVQQRRLDAEWFVLSLLRAVAPRFRHGSDRLPGWLESAIRLCAGDPASLQLGLPALVRACGRCPEHINRTVRHHFNITATELMNGLRLDHAARRLRLSSDDILSISLESGFDNLSYFYRLFRARFGTSPRRFRHDLIENK